MLANLLLPQNARPTRIRTLMMPKADQNRWNSSAALLAVPLLVVGCSRARVTPNTPAALGKGHNGPTEGPALRLALADVKETERELCPTSDQSTEGRGTNGKDLPTLQSASVKRERDWVVVTVNRQEGEDSSITRTHVLARRPHQISVALGCGRSLLLIPSPRTAPVDSAAPARIVAQVDSELTYVTSAPVTLLDSHEDWDGGSGGTLMTAQLKNGWLQVTSETVSPGSNGGESHSTVVDTFELSGFRRAQIADGADPWVFMAVP